MGIPIFILAGQSNASALSEEIEIALDNRYGIGNYELLEVYYAGAPLTREREDRPDWNDPAELREDLTKGVIELLDEDTDHVVGGMIWVQGEADTYYVGGAAGYSEDLESLIDGFRDDVSEAIGDKETGLDVAPVTILELSDNAPAAPDRDGWDIVISEQREVADGDALVATLDPDTVAEDAGVSQAAMFQDGLHFDGDFQFLLAGELVETMGPPGLYGIPQDEEQAEDSALPVDDPIEPVAEPIIPMVDPIEPNTDEDADFVDGLDDGSNFGDLAWLFVFLPFLGLLG